MLALIQIPWIDKRPVRNSHEGALYAVLDTIGSGNPGLAQRLHDSKTPPPYSAQLRDGLLTIGALTNEVIAAIDASRLAYKAQLMQFAEFDDLMAEPANRKVRLEFLTPTNFGKSGRDYVLPEPRLVFGSLVRRWRAVGGPEVPQIDWSEVGVLSVRLSTQKVETERFAAWGVTGMVTYDLGTDAAAQWCGALLRFGEYAGVGSKTGYGLGRIRIPAIASAKREQHE